MNELISNKTHESVDLSYLNYITAGSDEFMVEMIDLYLMQTPVYFKKMEEAIIQKNWLAVAQIAHKMKPTLACIGLGNSQQQLSELENKARNYDHIAVESIFLLFKKQLLNFITALENCKRDLALKAMSLCS